MANGESMPEIALGGGNVSPHVVRVGDTVRRPADDSTTAVSSLLLYLEDRGFAHAPRYLGSDDAGRQLLSWVPGRIQHAVGPMELGQLHRVGRIIRELHDLCADFQAPAYATWTVAIEPDRRELIVHHDLAPWNLVVDGARLTFIDWSGAGPGSRLWDLAYAVHGFTVATAASDPRVIADRIASLVDGYGLQPAERRRLAPMLAERTRSMHHLLVEGNRTGTAPWSRLYEEGHAEHWGSVSDYLQRHERLWASALGG